MYSRSSAAEVPIRPSSYPTALPASAGTTTAGFASSRRKSVGVIARSFESGGKLTIRDLGSSNGTYVNGKRVLGQQALTPGDELTLGAVTLRVAKLGQAATAEPAQAPAAKPKKAGDTAVVEAIPASDQEEEFEMEFEQEEPEVELDVIPLADDESVTPAAKSGPKTSKAGKAVRPAADKKSGAELAASPSKDEHGDEAIAQFLSDLKLDEDE